jgi:putative DeoR family transcriptional regulator (stage III sporulation protein D)
MRGYIQERATELAGYALERGTSIRATAKRFGMSHETVRKDFLVNLPQFNPELAGKIKAHVESFKKNIKR